MAHWVAPQAIDDLDVIWYYVAKESGNVDVANRLTDAITERFFLLAGHPTRARPAMTTLALARGAFQLATT